MLRRPAPRGASGDRGSVAVFTAVFAFAVMALLALLVDGGNALNARERADDIAEQAARAAVTDLSVPQLRQGTVAINWATACAYAQQAVTDYAKSFSNVTAAQMTSCGPGAAPRTAKITVQVTTQPVVPGFPATSATLSQTAAAACGNADQQEVC